MSNRTATSRTLLICLLALAVLGFRAPSPDLTVLQDAAVVAHDHHGHTHDDDEPPATSGGHEHDRFHVGDHSHETPNAAPALEFVLHALKDSRRQAPDARVASMPTPPGDRPPRQA